MEFGCYNIADTIVYDDPFHGDREEAFNSVSFTNLNAMQMYDFGIESAIGEGIYNDIEAFKQLDITQWRGEVSST